MSDGAGLLDPDKLLEDSPIDIRALLAGILLEGLLQEAREDRREVDRRAFVGGKP